MTGPSIHNKRAFSFRMLTVFTGVMLLVLFLSTQANSELHPFFAALLVGLAFVSERYPLTLPGYGVVSGFEAVLLTAISLTQPKVAVLVLLAGVISRSFRRGQNFHFSFACYSFFQIFLSYALPFALLQMSGLNSVLSFSLAAVTALSLDQLFSAYHLYLLQDRLGRVSTRIEWARLRLSVLGLLPAALLLSSCIQEGAVATVLLLAPLAVAFYGIKTYVDTLREARDVVASMVEAVERREEGTEGHAERVAYWAGSIAREMGLQEIAVRRVVAAAKMHDLGKIGIEESILNKAGKLSTEEMERLRRHPEVGAKVAGHLSLGKQEAQYIYHHHENFDGTGYPMGLAGNDIPQGARILAVAEAFDSMVSSPRRDGHLTPGAAMAELESAQGQQFDPNVVAAFRTVLRKRIA